MIDFISPDKYGEYDAFVESHPKGHFMQTRAWGKHKSNWKWDAVASRGDDGALRGTLAVLVRRMPGMPYTMMYGCRGPVCDIHDAEVVTELVAGARALAKKYRSYILTLDPDVRSDETGFASLLENLGFDAPNNSKNFESIQPRYVFRLDVSGRTEDNLLNAFEAKTRYNIRLAMRKGVEVRVCGDEMVDAFSAIMNETGSRDSFIVRDSAYFRSMLSALGEHARLYMAFYEDKPVAGTIAIHFGNKVWYLYGASSNESRNVMPNYLLQWEMIRWAIQTGCDIYDFRGVSGDLSPENPLYGLYRFKKGFSGEFTEFCGEFNLVLKPRVLSAVKLAKKARHVVGSVLRKK